VVRVLGLERVGEVRPEEDADAAQFRALLDEGLGERAGLAGALAPQDVVTGPDERGQVQRG
jgi:hypothetical protein